MNSLKRLAGLVWMALAAYAMYLMVHQAGTEFSKSPALDTRIFWYTIIPVFTPIMIGLGPSGTIALRANTIKWLHNLPSDSGVLALLASRNSFIGDIPFKEVALHRIFLIVYKMADGRSEKLLVVFVVFLLLFNYPLLTIFDRQEMWLGLPVLYSYMFFVWAAIIVTLRIIIKRKKK